MSLSARVFLQKLPLQILVPRGNFISMEGILREYKQALQAPPFPEEYLDYDIDAMDLADVWRLDIPSVHSPIFPNDLCRFHVNSISLVLFS